MNKSSKKKIRKMKRAIDELRSSRSWYTQMYNYLSSTRPIVIGINTLHHTLKEETIEAIKKDLTESFNSEGIKIGNLRSELLTMGVEYND